MSFCERPDFQIGSYTVSWKRASHTILVTGEPAVTDHVYLKTRKHLKSYAKQNKVLLLTSSDKLYLYGQNKRSILDYYMGRYREFSFEEQLDYEKDLMDSLIILIGPETFRLNQYALTVLRMLWRRARVLSIAVIAVLPQSQENLPFNEQYIARTQLNLFAMKLDIPQGLDFVIDEYLTIRVLNLFPSIAAVCREHVLT